MIGEINGTLNNADSFVAKFNSTGDLIWSTFLAGSNVDIGRGVVVDLNGFVYLIGDSFSQDFPLLNNEEKRELDGCFVSKFSSNGELLYSSVNSLIGDSCYSGGTDRSGIIYVIGYSFRDYYFHDLTLTSLNITDSDSDGLLDKDELNLGTNPALKDSDGDGIPDGWEVDNSLDPLVDDSSEDPDGDGLSNFQEYQEGKNPHLPDFQSTLEEKPSLDANVSISWLGLILGYVAVVVVAGKRKSNRSM